MRIYITLIALIDVPCPVQLGPSPDLRFYIVGRLGPSAANSYFYFIIEGQILQLI